MHTRQNSRRHTTQRLLLLAGATIGISAAITLGLSDDAHADPDHPEHADTTAAADINADLPAKVTTVATVKPPTPPPAHRAVDHAREKVVKQVTAKADTATRDLPTAGSTVDKARDLTGQAGATTTPPPVSLPLPLPPDIDVTTPPIAGITPPWQQRTGGPQPAPEPTTGGAPTPPTVGSGAATPARPTFGVWPQRHTGATVGHPAALRPATTPSAVQPAPPRQHPGDSTADGSSTRAGTTAGSHLDGTPADTCTHPHTAPHPAAGQHRDHTGRTWPPTPPSG